MGIEDIEIDEEVSFEELLNAHEKESKNRIVEGTVVSANQGDEYILIDVGQKVEGGLRASEVTDENGNLTVGVGDSLKVMILNSHGERPMISRNQAISAEKFVEFAEAHKEDWESLIIEGKITSVKRNAGYIVTSSEGIECFMPRSHARINPNNALGKTIKARILSLDEAKGNILISRKNFLEEMTKGKIEVVEKLMNEVEPIHGIVKKVASYGLFVEIGNGEETVDGLVKYNEISYKGPVNPSAYYNEGDEVFVKIIDFDKTKGQLSLSIKASQPNPWDEIADELEVGDAITVTVSNFENYGAFVDLGNDIEGLLHISEISWNKNIKHPKELLEIGQEVTVEVIALDFENQKLRVSLKRLQAKPFEEFLNTHKVGDVVKGKVVTITPFGAFINIGAVDGLLHNEELSWDMGVKCKDELKNGDEVEVKIIRVDREKENISFSRKALLDSPVGDYTKTHDVDDIVVGKVKDKKDFGIFVELAPKVDGLIRLEDLDKPAEEIEIGEEIESVIVQVNKNSNKIKLSVRRLQKQKDAEVLKQVNDTSGMTIGDLIKDKF
jgi:small subunit ribosomal protein S1